MRFKTILLLCVVAGWFGAMPAESQKTASKSAGKSGGAATQVSADIKAAAHAAAATGCDATLWKHVYHPTRLVVVEQCIQVVGTIHHIKPEADGDDHIQVMVDPSFAGLLNSRNQQAQAGSLVVEPICQGQVTQTDAMAACRDFHSPVKRPAEGDKVTILGSFVLDTEADHGWTEIHPVTSITKVTATTN